MDITTDDVVVSLAGHDKGGVFAVIGLDREYAIIADGRQRKIEKPKKKKRKHLKAIGRLELPSPIATNRELRQALRTYSEARATAAEGGI